MKTEELAKIVDEEFSFLQSKYGFGKLVIRNLGREVFFDYERDDETISISFEVGSKPIIEVYIPSDKTNIKPTPWAAKGEIKRSRLFPKINIKMKLQGQIFPW